MLSYKFTSDCCSFVTSQVVRRYCRKATREKLRVTAENIQTYGQPTQETHPGLLGENDVTPYVTRNEYQTRREKLVELVGKYIAEYNSFVKKHLIIIPSATKQYMSDKIPYFFRQNTDFLYLSGCQEPDCVLVITCDEFGPCSTLFMREKDEHSELWDGPRTGPDNAAKLFGVEQGLPSSEFEPFLHSYLKTHRASSLWYDYLNPIHSDVHRVMTNHMNTVNQKIWESPKMFLHQLRLIKSPAEQYLMQQSADAASAAIIDTIACAKPGDNEHEIFAKVDYECRVNGAQFLAYPPVVAGGNRANIIHYINNNQTVYDGELVLMDAGCEYHGYASDITRTWPINGQFSKEQLLVYEVLLEVQKELIHICGECPTLDNLFDEMCLSLGKGLQEIGVIPKLIGIQSLKRATYQLCPHHVSHYLGMDVHDTPLIKRNIQLQPGMVVTVEPGVYINYKQTQVPIRFRGLGMRIEDDVLITESGPVVLSKNSPKEVDEIEEIASRNQT